MTYPLVLDDDKSIAAKIKKAKTGNEKDVEQRIATLKRAVRDAEEAFDAYLSSLNYINETTGNYEDTQYWRIHPAYYKQWKAGEVIPSWAYVKQ